MTLRALRPLVLISLLAGCSGDDPAGPADDPAVGTYFLVEVDGESLPYTFNPPPLELQIIAGIVELLPDGSFEERVSFRTTNTTTGETSDELESHFGTWSREGGALRLSSQNVSYTGVSLVDGMLRYTATGIFSFDLVLERQ